MKPLPPIELPWKLKPLESAETKVERHADGRMAFSIRHDILRGVTPAMLVWWFQNLEGDMDVAGQRLSRYRVWHPRDHHSISYARRLPDGSIGPGAKIHIREFFAARPENKIDMVATIVRLDEGGFIHSDRVLSAEMARMSYTFKAVDGGTLYENDLVFGRKGAPLINGAVSSLMFPEKKGRAWLLHNIEEVGALENFLPALYDSIKGGATSG
jgi:hypothetical protein